MWSRRGQLSWAGIVAAVMATLAGAAAQAAEPRPRASRREGVVEVPLAPGRNGAPVTLRPAGGPLWGLTPMTTRRRPVRVSVGLAQAYVRAELHLPSGKETVTAEELATLPADVQATYRRLRPEGGEVGRGELLEAYRADTTERLAQAAGGKKWVTRVAAKSLPAGARYVWRKARDRARSSRYYDAALETAFPEGSTDHHLFFERSLPMVRKRAHHGAIERWKLLERLPQLVALVADGPRVLADGTRLEKVQDADGRRTGVRISKGRGNGFEVVGDANELLIGGRYDGVQYERLSIFARNAEAWKELKAQAKADPRLAGRLRVFKEIYADDLPEAQARLGGTKKQPGPSAKEVNDRFQRGTDWGLVAELARVTDLALNAGRDAKAIRSHYARWRKQHRDLAVRFLRSKDVLGYFRSVVASVRKAGEPISLGDYDDTLSIGDRYQVENDREQLRTLVSGKGPLLIHEDHAGGRAVVVPLRSLDQGAVEALLFDGTSYRGKLRLTADGKGDRVPRDFRFLYGLAFDLDQFPDAIRDALSER